MENLRESNHMITVPMDVYNALVRSDERLRIILDMMSDSPCLYRGEVLTVCGVEKVMEDKHE